MSFLLVIWLFSTATGQFILERGPSCSDGSLVYSCTRSDGFFLTWRFQPSGARGGIRTGDSPQTVTVGSSMVLLTVLPASGDSFISASATIAHSDSVRLNGTTISCGSDTLNISVPDVRRNLPAALELYKIESNIMIDPIPKSKVMGVLYIVTSVNNTMRSGILNGCAVLMQESNVAFNLSFICVDTSINFFIGDCIFQDYNENLTYTVFPNVTWTITCFTYSDEISDIMCMADGTWSVPNLCLKSNLVTTTFSSAATSEYEMTDTNIISSTSGPNSSSETSCSSGNLIVYLVTPMAAIFFALVGNIIVIVICFSKKKGKSMEDLDNIQLSNTSSGQRGNNNSQERCAINLVDNVAYEYITTK